MFLCRTRPLLPLVAVLLALVPVPARMMNPRQGAGIGRRTIQGNAQGRAARLLHRQPIPPGKRHWPLGARGGSSSEPADFPGARQLAWTPTDPLASREWNLAAVDAFAYSDTLPVLTEAPVTIAVIDGGIDRLSPDLAGVVPLAPIDEAHDPTTSLEHGTAVAGIIAAEADNGIGGVGVGAPYARLLDYRVVSGGNINPDVEAQAIRDAVGAGARVINLSLGGNRDPKHPALDRFSRAERDAVSYAVQRGVVVVAAVGNSMRGLGAYASWPAALPHVIGVSAVDQNLAWASFSNTDPVFNDIAAPGVGIITTVPRTLAPTGSSLDAPADGTIGADGTVVGTSFAAPHVSAAAAVLLARHPTLTATQVIWILERTARRLDQTTSIERSRFTGFGLLDVSAALKLADGPAADLPPPCANEPNDTAARAQALATSTGQFDSLADFGDDRRDVYKIYVRPGEKLQIRTDPLPLGGNLQLDVQAFPPDTHNLANSPKLAIKTIHAPASRSALSFRNTGTTAGFYLIQVSARRGWGAYRLGWNTTH